MAAAGDPARPDGQLGADQVNQLPAAAADPRPGGPRTTRPEHSDHRAPRKERGALGARHAVVLAPAMSPSWARGGRPAVGELAGGGGPRPGWPRRAAGCRLAARMAALELGARRPRPKSGQEGRGSLPGEPWPPCPGAVEPRRRPGSAAAGRVTRRRPQGRRRRP